MIRAVYTRTFTILKKIPVKLWGLSLLNGLLAIIAIFLCPLLPIVSIPVVAALEASMIAIYYKNYTEGVTPDSKPMFAAFKDFKTFKHVAGGMCWMTLWIVIWSLIPIAGIVFAVYKAIQYSFTPYILLEEPSVGALDALKKSKDDTKGLKGQIFLGVVLPSIAYTVAVAILTALGYIPYVGIVFVILTAIAGVVYSLVSPLFFGLVQAGFYEYGKKPAQKSVPVVSTVAAPAAVAEASTVQAAEAQAEAIVSAPSITCATCGSENTPDKKFCGHCGAKL